MLFPSPLEGAGHLSFGEKAALENVAGQFEITAGRLFVYTNHEGSCF
jgi:hypothetical protein